MHAEGGKIAFPVFPGSFRSHPLRSGNVGTWGAWDYPEKLGKKQSNTKTKNNNRRMTIDIPGIPGSRQGYHFFDNHFFHKLAIPVLEIGNIFCPFFLSSPDLTISLCKHQFFAPFSLQSFNPSNSSILPSFLLFLNPPSDPP